MKSFPRLTLSLLVLLALQPVAHADVLKDHQGSWLGDMKIPNGQTLKIGAELFTRADGSSWASIAVPEQDTFDSPVNSIHENGSTVDLEFDGVSLKLTWATDHFNGVFQEVGGPALTFPLTRVTAFPKKVRPQTPEAPFPYRDETLAIASTDGVTLGATLTMPHGAANPNVVILVHGSGPITRDANGTFSVLADHLARQGIAVLRYDKRGIGKSTGAYKGATSLDLASDAEAAVRFLRGRAEVSARHIGIIGHSEGGLIAPIVASRDPAIGFVVMLAGPGVRGELLMVEQLALGAKANGAPDALVASERALNQAMFAALVSEPNIDAANNKARLFMEEAERQGTMPVGAAKEKLKHFSTPWFHTFLRHEPAPFLKATRQPILVLNGERDLQVPSGMDLGAIRIALQDNPRAVVKELPNLNHLFQTAKTGSTAEYFSIEETMAPLVLTTVSDWIQTTVR